MSKITFGMMVSLDGYIEGPAGGPALPEPNEELHQYFNDLQKRTALNLYGRRMYEVMKYWDTADQNLSSPAVEVEYARAWQSTPKAVFSTTLNSVGPNARLFKEVTPEVLSTLRDEVDGDIEVAGPALAASLSRLGLIDEYRLYTYPIVLGGGKPFFAPGTSLKLDFVATERLPHNVMLLRYQPIR